MTATIDPTSPAPTRLLRIQEVATELGLTPRSIRYYEELGLLSPAARSQGAYRLYDESDVERLRFIKALRDDAGFSLAEIGQLLEDETARARSSEAFHQSTDRRKRRALLSDSLARADRQVAILQTKVERLQEMVAAAEVRRDRLRARLADIAAGGTGETPEPVGESRATR
ncbi:MAG TPA: MerR family transcriptional regulator [Candidatus Limnocylindria bacterium]|nr:MerR family transcriptional regulator [Candidatus Limnocylindria bacterium]